MSHFSTLKTKLSDKVILIESLKDLGYTVKEDTEIRGYHGATLKADIVAVLDCGVDIGWTNYTDSYELAGDMWALDKADINVGELINAVNQKYAVNTALAAARQSGMQNATIKVAVAT